jgi:K+/H+ antiporter YhaU regulatory subunit KhtT
MSGPTMRRPLRDHTAVIGWSDQVFPIISELIEANAGRRRRCVAILADKDRAEMDDEVRKMIGKTGSTRVVCRTGNPIDPGDLDIVSLRRARSIIVLTPPGESPDAQITKILLAITQSPTRRKEPYHVVAAVRDSRNHQAAQLAGGEETVLVDSDDIAARLIVQAGRRPGLSAVYQALLDFAGGEIRLTAQPGLTGRTFGEALSAYRTSTVIGLRRNGGMAMIRPPMDTKIENGDEVIAISTDDDTAVLSDDEVTPIEGAIVAAPPSSAAPERTLMLGWNRRAAGVVRHLDAYVVPGSTLDVVAGEADAKLEIDHVGPGLRNLAVSFSLGDTDARGALEPLDIGGYDRAIVLCHDEPDRQHADSRALITLLHLRQILAEKGRHCPIVSEMSDDRNRRLAQVTRADDIVVGDKLISLLMVRLSENRHLAEVFADLFGPEGSEVCLQPVGDYVRCDVEIDFYTMVEAARRRGEVVIGYRLGDRSGEAPDFGVVLNPDKTQPLTFSQHDQVIVLAEVRAGDEPGLS